MASMYAVPKPRKPTWYSGAWEKVSFNQLLLASWLALCAHTIQSLVVKGNLSAIGLLMFSLMAMITLSAVYFWEAPHRHLIVWQRWLLKYGLAPAAWLLSLLTFFLDSLAIPVNAQTTGESGGSTSGFFFTNILTKVNAVLSANPNSATVIPIINFGFGILQILMIAYIAFSVARVINAARDDEDWKQAAKIPLIVVMAVVAGDFAVGLI